MNRVAGKWIAHMGVQHTRTNMHDLLSGCFPYLDLKTQLNNCDFNVTLSWTADAKHH